ncbi:carboxyl-terminal processing protease [Natranaerovirga hydrolytica]|uniref:Carboxyl-terminal processing protease n=1 Tax=Natranaerovirga hydrolytica TaxID=680378 RepID=A0A4R1MKS8_9FIRM|nr:S41 family peptidase [Natranaerovirga hydrolytica]TCK93346.1 carboxyl-terminal processing protease [Natranaerovirga hydrolytica]
MKKRIITLVLVVALVFTTNYEIYATTPREAGQDVEDLMTFILNQYVGEDVASEELYYGALKGMFDVLDDYSEFYTEEEFQMFFEEMSNSFYGIGAELESDGQYIKIVNVLKNSPAEKAGLLNGDLIIEVNGASIESLSIDAVVSEVRGEKGTTVEVTISRNSEIIRKEIIRDEIKMSSIYQMDLSKIYEDDSLQSIEYINITQFSEGVAEEFDEALRQSKDNNKEYLIVDLRYNSGGYLDEVVDIANDLVPLGAIMYTVGMDNEEYGYYSMLVEKPYKKIVVLTNEYTASASEILASAIVESEAGITVGERTFGKGIVQQIFTYGNGGFKLTVEEYFSRNKNKINGEGVMPTIEVKVPNLLPQLRYRYNVGMADEYVYEINSILEYLGYTDQSPRNAYDEQTNVAIRAFQRDNNLYPSGICDFATQTKLNEILRKEVGKEDRQLIEAINYIKEISNN